MRTEVIKADSIDEAVGRILDELKEDDATTARSISSRNNVIYFDGWEGLGASAVLRAVAQRLTAMALSDEAPAGLQFDQILHMDCSKWESRRALQRAIAEQLKLPAKVMEMFDRQDAEDDYNGLAMESRAEIPQIAREMYGHVTKVLLILHNGSDEEIDMASFCGFPLSGYSTNKMLWTFQGRFRLCPRIKVDRAFNKSTAQGAATDVFLSAVTERDPQAQWPYLVLEEAADLLAAVAAGKSNNGHGIIQLKLQQGQSAIGSDEDDDAPWRAADALQREMQLDVEYWRHNLESLPSCLVGCGDRIASMPYWTSPPYEALLSLLGDMFQQFDKLGVLKLSRCTFSFLSPPFHSCVNQRILSLHHCKDQEISLDGAPEKMEEDTRRLFQKLWVLNVCYSRCDRILSAQMIVLMTRLRELNVVGAHDWDIGQLQGRLPHIRRLRVTKSKVRCSGHSEQDLFQGMNSMELLDFSGNHTMIGITEISTSNNCLETMTIVDGCVGLQKFSLRGCAKLKNLLLRGLFEDLRILDLSGTALKTLDLSAITTRRLHELILDNCDKLCAIQWPLEDKRNMDLPRVHIDTTQSASTSRSREEIMKSGTTGSPSSWPMVLVNGAQQPSEFNWYISIKDTRLLRSFVPSFKNYFGNHWVHLEISSPRCYPTIDVGGSENDGMKNGTREEPQIVSNRQRQQAQCGNNNASMYYADVATIIVEEHLVQGGEGNYNDAPTITRTKPCPPPVDLIGSSDCYLYTQDLQTKTKATMDDGAIATIPSIICDRACILHVHDSLYNTSIPGPVVWEDVRWCRVERCPRLDYIFTARQLGHQSSDVHICWYLRTFWASQLPRTRFMWDTSKLPLSQIHDQSFEEVELLHLEFCLRFIDVLPFSSSVRARRDLKTIEIVWCGDLRVVFPLLDTKNTESHQEQQQNPPGAIITMMDFPNLKHIHLHELPKLESICGLGRMYAPELETIKIRGCWSLRHLPAVSSDRSNNKVECDCEKEWWDRLEWDGLDGKHHPSLYRPVRSITRRNSSGALCSYDSAPSEMKQHLLHSLLASASPAATCSFFCLIGLCAVDGCLCL